MKQLCPTPRSNPPRELLPILYTRRLCERCHLETTDSGADLTVALVTMTMGMATTTSVATKMTAGVPSEQTVSAAEVCLVRTSAEALRRMSTAKQVKAA